MRNECYREVLLGCPEFDDRLLEKRDLRNMIKILRSWTNPDLPMLRQKVVETAANLFKRHCLVKSFMNSNHVQTIMCAIYLSLKIQEIDEKGLRIYAERLMKKNYEPKACHYGEEGYTDYEMLFLASINFQIKSLSAIRPFESLLGRVKESVSDKTKQLRVEKEFLQIMDMVYFDDLFFLAHPAKIALCIVLIVLEKNNLSYQCIDRNGDIKSIIDEFPTEIEAIKQRVKELKRFDHKDASLVAKFTEFRSLMKDEQFKKPNLKRSSMSNIVFFEPPKY